MNLQNLIPFNFCGLTDEFSKYANSKFVILPIPYESTTSYGSGTAKGPQAIIDASRYLELYDEDTGKSYSKYGIHTLGEVESIVSHPEIMLSQVEQVITKLLEDNKFVVMLGGEHSLTYGSVKAHTNEYSDLSVLQLDAHADLRESYQGSRFSHACVMRRVLKLCQITQVGIRSLSSEEARLINNKNMRYFSVRDFRRLDFAEIIDTLSEKVYVTIDVDAFDPSIMPSTGTPEPGGLLWYETIDFLREVAVEKHIVGFDVVELSPIPGTTAPDFMVAKLIYKLLGCALQ